MNRGNRLLALVTPLLVAAGFFASGGPASATTYPGSDWKTISAGDSKTCGIRTNGRLYCWNTDGTGSSLFSISGYSDWKSVSVGRAHQCAIRGTGLLYCWGDDTYGQVGNGSTTGNPSSPVRVAGTATTWKSVSAGANHTCAVLGSGYLYCWGDDTAGQLGNGSTDGSQTGPDRVAGTSTSWKSVTAGGTHTCGILGTGYLYCWGDDTNGQVGNGDTTGNPTGPVRVAGTATTWKSVSAGANHTCAVLGSGYLYCWGDDTTGQLGNGSGTTAGQAAPTRITTVYDWRSISAGSGHTCGVRAAGALYCWGDNTYGQVGGSANPVQSPLRYSTLNDWTAPDTGSRFSCGLRGAGSLYCWGAQQAPSNGTPAGTAYPAQVLDLRRWKLTIPYDGSDADTVADEIKWPTLGTYRNLNFFHTTSDNKAAVFRAQVGGAKTGGSVFARSELRERTLWDGSSQANCDWSNQSGTHTMRITQKVTHLPRVIPRVVVGQIHDPRDEVVMVRVNGTDIIAEASYPHPDYPDGRKVTVPLAGGYRVGTTFTIRITAGPTGVAVYYNEGLSGAKTAWFAGRVARNASPDKTTGDGWFFKAGLYLQTNTAKGEAPTEYGEGVISNLTINHSDGVCG